MKNNILTLYRSIFSECIRRSYQGDEISSKKLFSELLSVVKTNQLLKLYYKLYSSIATVDKESIINQLTEIKKLNKKDIINLSSFLFENFKSITNLEENKLEKEINSMVFEKDIIAEQIYSLLEKTIEIEKSTDLKFFDENRFLKFAVKKFNSRYSKILTTEEKRLLNLLRSVDNKKLLEEKNRLMNMVFNYKKIIENRGDGEQKLLDNIEKLLVKIKPLSIDESIFKLIELENSLIEAIDG